MNYVAIWVSIFVTFRVLSNCVFEFCKILSIWVFYILSCKILSFWDLSQFKLLGFVTIWVFEFCHNLNLQFSHNLSFCVLSPPVFFFIVLSPFHLFRLFSHNLRFWVLSQFQFLSFVTIWFFWVLSQFEFLTLPYYFSTQIFSP